MDVCGDIFVAYWESIVMNILTFGLATPRNNPVFASSHRVRARSTSFVLGQSPIPPPWHCPPRLRLRGAAPIPAIAQRRSDRSSTGAVALAAGRNARGAFWEYHLDHVPQFSYPPLDTYLLVRCNLPPCPGHRSKASEQLASK